MKTLTTLLVSGAFVSGLLAQSNVKEMDQRFMAKYGRPSPATEAQLRDEQANTAYRADPASPAAPTNWTELYFQAKFGRNSPMEEARLKAERDSTAYREERYQTEPAKTWQDHWFKAKYGRDRN